MLQMSLTGSYLPIEAIDHPGLGSSGSTHDPHDSDPFGPRMRGQPVLSCPGVHILVGEFEHWGCGVAVGAPCHERSVPQPPGDVTDRAGRGVTAWRL